MSNVTVLNQDLPDFLQKGVSDLTKKLMGGAGSGVQRIVPKNGIFRKVVGGEEMGKLKGNLNAIIVNASPKVGRVYYAKQWSPESQPAAPDCFSNDGQTPDEGVNNPQSDRCDSCPQNIKGSGMGNSKACRYSRRIALVLEDDFGTSMEGKVYQMNLASKSLFGDSVSDNTHPFENYTKYLGNNGKSLDYVVTQISFNEDNDNQSVLFTPVRFIRKEEHDVTSKVGGTPEVQKLITMTPYQADMSGKAPQLAAPKEEAVVEDSPAPVKRDSKKAEPTVTAKPDLEAVVQAWSNG